MPISPRMKNPPTGGREKAPKRGAPKDDDDVDEHGNVAGLIDYDYESEEDDGDSQVSLTKSELYNLKNRIKQRKHRAWLLAKEIETEKHLPHSYNHM